jgi:hypothetical protein
MQARLRQATGAFTAAMLAVIKRTGRIRGVNPEKGHIREQADAWIARRVTRVRACSKTCCKPGDFEQTSSCAPDVTDGSSSVRSGPGESQ